MKKNLFILVLLLAGFITKAQTNWSNVDFIKEYKVKSKMPGGVVKSFKANPTFVNDYYIAQVSLQKGSSRPGMMQKQGVKAVFSEAALAGVSKEGIQKLIDELHAEFVKELEAIGLNITNGDDIINTALSSGKKQKKNRMIGKTDGQVIFDKGGISDPDIKEQNIFRPNDKNVFMTTSITGGNFYNNASKKAKTNMISIGYTIRFAAFESMKTNRKNKLTTKAGLMIIPTIAMVNPKGLFAWVTFEKPIYGNNEWSEGLLETDSRDGKFWGLSSSAEYSLKADEAKYIEELRQIVTNLQKDLAAHIQAKIK